VPVPSAVALRGVVEGFSGTPWTPTARRRVLELLAAHGANAYVYGPRDEPKQRAKWREPYDPGELRELGELRRHLAHVGVRMGVALGPAGDLDAADPDERNRLWAKLGPLTDSGVDWLVLDLDGAPGATDAGPAHADLAAWLHGRLHERLPGARLDVLPAQFVGAVPSPYLSALASRLPRDVGVMWTGPTVCSPTITTADARDRKGVLGGRSPLVWDNYPVNDGFMKRSLHLGPYRGRDAGIGSVVQGVLCNPMPQAYASAIPLLTAMEFLADPAGYDCEAAWERAVRTVAGERRTRAVRTIAHACTASPLHDVDDLPLSRLVDELDAEGDGPGWPGAVAALREVLEEAQDAAEGLAGPTDEGPAEGAIPEAALATELFPWARQAAREARAGLAALALYTAVRPVARVSPIGDGRAAAPDAEAALAAAGDVLNRWSEALQHDQMVFGARFAAYPAVVVRAPGPVVLDVRQALITGRSAIDRLCRLSLLVYEAWVEADCPAGPASLRVVTGTETLEVDSRGRFRVPPTDGVLLVRSGKFATRCSIPDAPPLADPRLS
jgi:hyaluronoglucosaminidase